MRKLFDVTDIELDTVWALIRKDATPLMTRGGREVPPLTKNMLRRILARLAPFVDGGRIAYFKPDGPSIEPHVWFGEWSKTGRTGYPRIYGIYLNRYLIHYIHSDLPSGNNLRHQLFKVPAPNKAITESLAFDPREPRQFIREELLANIDAEFYQLPFLKARKAFLKARRTHLHRIACCFGVTYASLKQWLRTPLDAFDRLSPLYRLRRREHIIAFYVCEDTEISRAHVRSGTLLFRDLLTTLNVPAASSPWEAVVRALRVQVDATCGGGRSRRDWVSPSTLTEALNYVNVVGAKLIRIITSRWTKIHEVTLKRLERHETSVLVERRHRHTVQVGIKQQGRKKSIM